MTAIGTIQVGRSQWLWLDVYIQTSAGAPVTGLTAANFALRYKKNNEITLSTKILGSIDVLVDENALAAATTLVCDDVSEFPLSGRVLINPGNPTAETRNYTIVPGNTTDLTLTAGLTNPHVIGETVRLYDFYELGFGMYTFLFAPSELDTLGQMSVIATPSSGIQSVLELDIIYQEEANSEVAPSVTVCRLYGYVMDLQGLPKKNVGVSARILATPELISDVGIHTDTVAARTDVNGYFNFTVLQGATIDVSIPAIGYRRTIVVPTDDAANLFEIEEA